MSSASRHLDEGKGTSDTHVTHLGSNSRDGWRRSDYVFGSLMSGTQTGAAGRGVALEVVGEELAAEAELG